MCGLGHASGSALTRSAEGGEGVIDMADDDEEDATAAGNEAERILRRLQGGDED